MTVEDKIRRVFEQLLECKGDDARGEYLARRLRELQHQVIEDARSQVRVLPFLNTARNSKKMA